LLLSTKSSFKLTWVLLSGITVSSTKSIFNQLTSLVWSALQIKNWMKKSQNACLGKQNGFGPTFLHSLFAEAAAF
jgi:hypothetical protein